MFFCFSFFELDFFCLLLLLSSLFVAPNRNRYRFITVVVFEINNYIYICNLLQHISHITITAPKNALHLKMILRLFGIIMPLKQLKKSKIKIGFHSVWEKQISFTFEIVWYRNESEFRMCQQNFRPKLIMDYWICIPVLWHNFDTKFGPGVSKQN